MSGHPAPHEATSDSANSVSQSPQPLSALSSDSYYSQQSQQSLHPPVSDKSTHLDGEPKEHEDEEDDGASISRSLNERAFSVVSFSIHRGPSAASVNTVDSGDSARSVNSASTVRCTSKTPSAAFIAGPPGASGLLAVSGSGDRHSAKDSKSLKSLKNLSAKSVRSVGKKSATTRKNAKKGAKFGLDLGSWWRGIHQRKEGSGIEAGGSDKHELDQLEESYPDGGLRAWLMVFGAMCNTFSTFGYVNSWGIFQAYYQTNLLSSSSPSNIAWIGSIQYALVFFPGLITGRLFDLGYFRSVFLPSSLLLVLATFLVAECHVYWQFLLCQGILVGLGCGGIFGPTTAVIAHWFKKRRGVAMGLVAVGSSIGGTLFPIATQNLISRVGFKWTMRILGCILVFTLGLSNLLLKRRLPPKHTPGGLLNLAAFKSPAYTVYCLSAFTTFLGIYTVLTYIDVSAADTPGVGGTKLAFYLVSIANASSLVGRYVAGVICDQVGPVNVMTPFTAAAGVVTFAWPFARTKGSLVGVAVVYGFCSGSYVSLLANPLMDLGDAGDVGRRIGMFMSILALGALAGPPISGAIMRETGGFEVVGFYAGSMVLLGVLMMVLTRWLVLRRAWGRM